MNTEITPLQRFVELVGEDTIESAVAELEGRSISGESIYSALAEEFEAESIVISIEVEVGENDREFVDVHLGFVEWPSEPDFYEIAAEINREIDANWEDNLDYPVWELENDIFNSLETAINFEEIDAESENLEELEEEIGFSLKNSLAFSFSYLLGQDLMSAEDVEAYFNKFIAEDEEEEDEDEDEDEEE